MDEAIKVQELVTMADSNIEGHGEGASRDPVLIACANAF